MLNIYKYLVPYITLVALQLYSTSLWSETLKLVAPSSYCSQLVTAKATYTASHCYGLHLSPDIIKAPVQHKSKENVKECTSLPAVNKFVSIVGYPTQFKGKYRVSFHRVKSVHPRHVVLTGAGMPGQSGGGAYYKDTDGQLCAFGVLSSGGVNHKGIDFTIVAPLQQLTED